MGRHRKYLTLAQVRKFRSDPAQTRNIAVRSIKLKKMASSSRITMLGNFQQSHLRIELNASETKIKDSLLKVNHLRQWLWPQTFEASLPAQLHPGLSFTSWVGLIPIQHQIESVNDHCLRMLLSQGIDGYHEWCWGDGWVQSRLEGISLLPLNLGQTWSLTKLRQFVTARS